MADPNDTQRIFELDQDGFNRFAQRRRPLAREVQEILAGKPVGMREDSTAHDVRQGVGEVPGGDQVVRGFLKTVGTSGQSLQASSAGRDILFDDPGGNPLPDRVQQFGRLRRALFDICRQIPAVGNSRR